MLPAAGEAIILKNPSELRDGVEIKRTRNV